jgi:CheY-like chemotaxis protein
MKNAADIGSARTGNIPPAGEAREDVRALIIDDDQYVRSMIARLLARLGVTEVCQAAVLISGKRGLQLTAN